MNQLLLLDSRAQIVRRVRVNDGAFGVACHPVSGAAWVVVYGKGLLEIPVDKPPRPLVVVPARGVAIGTETGHLWAYTGTEVLRLDSAGNEVTRYPLPSVSSQSWIAAR